MRDHLAATADGLNTSMNFQATPHNGGEVRLTVGVQSDACIYSLTLACVGGEWKTEWRRWVSADDERTGPGVPSTDWFLDGDATVPGRLRDHARTVCAMVAVPVPDLYAQWQAADELLAAVA